MLMVPQQLIGGGVGANFVVGLSQSTPYGSYFFIDSPYGSHALALSTIYNGEYTGLWVNPPGFTPNLGNYFLLADGTTTQMSGPEVLAFEANGYYFLRMIYSTQETEVYPGINFGINAITGSYGGGVGVFGIANARTVPTTNPTGGGVMYTSGGALYYRGSSGTVTTIAPP
jgi:hypothetical protein